MMLTPWGPSAVPTGGAGVALPAGSSIFSTARTFFLPTSMHPSSGHVRPLVDLLDLQEVELHRRLAPEHLDQDVSGKDPLLNVAALAVFDLDLVLHGDEHLEDLVLHVHGLDPLLEVLLHLLLVSGVGVDDVPLRLSGRQGEVDSLSCHDYPVFP